MSLRLLDPGGRLLELLARFCIDSGSQSARLDLLSLHVVAGYGLVLDLVHHDNAIYLLRCQLLTEVCSVKQGTEFFSKLLFTVLT